MSQLWKIFRDGVMIVPVVGRRVHYIEADDDPCSAAEVIDFTGGLEDDATAIEATLIAYEPDTGDQVVVSGVILSGVDGPTFPNWHYSNHNSNLVP